MFPSSSAFPPVCPSTGAALPKRARLVQVCVSGDLVLSECRVVGAGACGGFTQVRPAGSGCHAARGDYPMHHWARRYAHTQARTEMPTGTHALVNAHMRARTHTQHARAHARGRGAGGQHVRDPHARQVRQRARRGRPRLRRAAVGARADGCVRAGPAGNRPRACAVARVCNRVTS